MDTLTVVNPVATPSTASETAERHPPAPRVVALDDKVIALYWNGKQNGLDALARTRELFEKRFAGLTFIDVTGELGGTNRFLSEDQLAMLADKADAVVATSADCGRCTSVLSSDRAECKK